MEVSSCCGAPIIVEYQTDVHYSDDDYELKVPVWVCSTCGAVVKDKRSKDKV